MSSNSLHNSISVKSLPFNLSESKGFKTLIKPLSIKTFPVRKALNEHNPNVTLDYMDLDSGDAEKKLLSVEESGRQNSADPPKKLTKFFYPKKAYTKQLSKNDVFFFTQAKLFILTLIDKAISVLRSLGNGTAIFFADLSKGMQLIFLTMVKFILMLFVRFTLWKELKWPAEKSPHRKKSTCLNTTLIKKWKTCNGLGTKPLTLVLDLDETLIHTTTVAKLGGKCEPLLIIQTDGTYKQIYLKRRPYLDSFLEKLSREYNIVIFTAARLEYADSIIDLIDPASYITKRLYRESCARVGQGWIKDIRKVGSDLTKTVLLDNCPVAGNLHPDNHLLIKPWFGDEKDRELLKYMETLLDYANKWKTHVCDEIAKDIREFIKKDLLKIEPQIIPPKLSQH